MGTYYKFYVHTNLYKKDKKTKDIVKKIIKNSRNPEIHFDNKQGISIYSNNGDILISDIQLWNKLFKKLRSYLTGNIRAVNQRTGNITDYWYADKKLKKSATNYFIKIEI